ncbi:putative aldo-keto reductase [Hypoxylon argillaceum]|nr:putative aldo-keto reductase [Hypoxylon argillaceum]
METTTPITSEAKVDQVDDQVAIQVTDQSRSLIIYGTAWKEGRTADLTAEALEKGFRVIDSANYPTGYNEPLVGEGIARALQVGLDRDALFIQSKFTPVWAHDKDKIPFNPEQDIENQVRESIQTTFDNLKVDYLDSFLLHAPTGSDEDDIKVWKTLETYFPDKIKRLGVSNFPLPALQKLYNAAVIKPTIVQNRFYKETSFDLDVRSFCADHNITYQAFYMLTHNPELIESDVIKDVSNILSVSKQEAFYLLILALGNTQVLDGTTNGDHMNNDLKAVEKVFDDPQLQESLQPYASAFKQLLWKVAGPTKTH